MASKLVKDLLTMIQGLSQQDQIDLKKGINDIEIHPCLVKGHKYRVIGPKEFRWFRPPAAKAVCTACGDVQYF